MTTRDYEASVLAGSGGDDYAKYMKTVALLSLQVDPESATHRDEMLFQIVHQTTELWLKLACNELDEARRRLERRCIPDASALIARSVHAVRLITDQLAMLSHMTPWDFQKFRGALGNGSGFESPGWRLVQKTSKAMSDAFDDWRNVDGVDLVALYKLGRHSDDFVFVENLVDWDEAVSLWRARHYKTATRTIGHGTVGTKGTPVDKLAALLSQKFFPVLWETRSVLYTA